MARGKAQMKNHLGFFYVKQSFLDKLLSQWGQIFIAKSISFTVDF